MFESIGDGKQASAKLIKGWGIINEHCKGQWSSEIERSVEQHPLR